jgi:hypothetical protein
MYVFGFFFSPQNSQPNKASMELERDYLRKARRKNRETLGYFDDDDDDESLSRNGSESTSLRESNDMPATANGPAQDEIDPLDAFMAGISAQVKQEQSSAKQPAAKVIRGILRYVMEGSASVICLRDIVL